MLTIDPAETPQKDLHQFMLGTVAPRPIAFVSTIDDEGRPNLAPYSFFNAFSSNPPIVVFSSNRRGTNNTTKDTLENIRGMKECVINAVNYNIVRQMAVASVEFPTGVSEFEKTGLTPVASDLVKPPRVGESPAAMECVVQDIITLGDKGGDILLFVGLCVCMWRKKCLVNATVLIRIRWISWDAWVVRIMFAAVDRPSIRSCRIICR